MSKKDHRSNKKCPECEDGKIEIIRKKEIYGDFEYQEKYEHCPLCGYEKQITNNKKRCVLEIDLEI